MNRKTVYLIFFLFIILTIVIIVQISSSQNQSSGDKKTPKPVTQLEPQPNEVTNFYITGNSINNRLIGVTEGFDIFFSKPLSEEGVSYEINPSTRADISINNNILTISPYQAWEFDKEYVLTIKKETRSHDSLNLGSDAIVHFKTIPYSGL